MSNSPESSLDIDALMAQIRAEVAQRRGSAPMVDLPAPRATVPTAPAGSELRLAALPMPPPLSPEFAAAPRHHLNDFLAYHDGDFVDAAYHGVLRRDADASGRAHYLAGLREGRLGKIEILGRLRYSAEGRHAGVPVARLPPAYAAQLISRVPVIGGVFAFFLALWRLPRLSRHLQAVENYQHFRDAESRSLLGALTQAVDSNAQRIAARLAQQHAHVLRVQQRFDAQLLDALQLAQHASAHLTTTVAGLSALIQRMDQIEPALADAQQRQQRFAERLLRLETLAKPEIAAAARATLPQSTQSVDASTRFDALYFAFEQRFRGSREDIRGRLQYYLPLLHNSVVGTHAESVLDIGCGRGEWLELLRDESIRARGIDLDASMADACVQRGLDVAIDDAVAHLRRLPDQSLGAITGFHIIEHVPLDTLLEIFEQARRVLKPNGIVIFETPNPENIVVGACNFYVDPTHRRPLPPVLTQFLLESAGFRDVAIHRVNAHLLPRLFDEPAPDDSAAVRTALAFLHSQFACAPDYSVVGTVT